MAIDSPSGPQGGYVPFAGIFDAILQDAAQRAYMETEGMYTQAEEAFETAQRDLRDIQFTVPQDQQADALADYLRKSGYSSHVVEQTLGIPRSEVDAALMAAGYDVYGNKLPEEDVFADTTATTVDEPEDMPIADLGVEPQFEDPNEVFKEKAGEDLDLKGIIDLAFDVFGAYNRDAISNVVDIVNQRGISVGEVAQATGNTVESINQAAAESGTAIENQDTGEVTVDEGPAIGPQPPITVDEGPAIGPTPEPTPEPDDEPPSGIFTGPVGDDTPPPETPIQILTETPTPQPTPQMGLLAMIQSTPVTEQMFSRELFEPKLRELDNVAQALGMIQDIGRRF